MSGLATRPPALLMEAVRGADDPTETAVLDLRLEAGEFALLRIGDPARAALCADLACGAAAAVEGRVNCLGQDWARLPYDIADALRGRIGRIFGQGGWLPHLSMAENILLPMLHHTRTAVEELRDRAAYLARAFGLPGLPVGRPGSLPAADLARAACVRAFLGEPMLLLLENPLLHGRVPELAAPLRDAIAAARARGAACLWMTSSPAVWEDQSLPCSQRLVLTELGLRARRRRV